MSDKPKRNSELRNMVHEIDDRGRGLTKWEVNFIADMIDSNRVAFTAAQSEMIERIYEERV